MRINRRRHALIVSAAAASALLACGARATRAAIVSFTSSKDNTLYEDPAGFVSNGSGEAFFAGNTANGGKRRGLLAFDLQAALPSNAQIFSASLTLMSLRAPTTSGLDLHVAQKDWGEGASNAGFGSHDGGGTPAAPGDATWLHTFYNTSFWTTPGGDFSPTISSSTAIPVSVGAGTFPMTPQLNADVQGWVNDPASNFGWVVRGDETATATAKRLGTHENPDPAARPKLTVDYSASNWKTASAAWSNNANWDFGVPNAVGAEANFTFSTGAAGSGIAVAVDGAKTVAIVNFDSTNSYALSGSTLTLDRAAGRNAINVASGNHQIASAVNLNRSTDVTTAAGSTLTISGAVTAAAGVTVHKLGDGSLVVNNLRADGLTQDGGTVAIAPNGGSAGASKLPTLTLNAGRLDLSNNKLITANPVGTASAGVYDGVSALIQSGRNGGGWTGANGIVTSQSSATSGNFTSLGVATAAQAKGIAPGATAVFAGQTVTGTDTLVMYTYGGDANLDGKINVDDYGHIDSSIPIGLAGWFNGDFNYDGKINVDDYGIIDFNIGIQGAPFSTAANDGLAAVPEPGGALIILAGGAALVRRRRTR